MILCFILFWPVFRMLRKYLPYCPEEEPKNLSDAGLNSYGVQGHFPVHFLLISAAEVGFSWDGEEKG